MHLVNRPLLHTVQPGGYSLFAGFIHLAAGLACGFTGMAAGYAIGIVGDSVSLSQSLVQHVLNHRFSPPVCQSLRVRIESVRYHDPDPYFRRGVRSLRVGSVYVKALIGPPPNLCNSCRLIVALILDTLTNGVEC